MGFSSKKESYHNSLSISVILYAKNEEKNLKRLFSSLKGQSYSKNKIEYILVNDASSDNTKQLAIDFGASVVDINTGDIELNKGIGMHKAKNDLLYWMDADMQVCDKDFFKKLVHPLTINNDLVASFTNEFAIIDKRQIKNSFLRFISYDELQRDPLYQIFSPSISKTIVKKQVGYYVCNFNPGMIPPAGRSMYRKSVLKKAGILNEKTFIDLETLAILTEKGFNKFAYVPEAKIRHYHANNLGVLIKKRVRNLTNDYLPNIKSKKYTWFDLSKNKDRLKIFFWIIWVNLFIPELLVGIYKSLKFWDHAFLWQPIVSLATTDVILFKFLTTKGGWKIIYKAFS